MAEFKQGNVKVKDDKALIFGNNDDYALTYDVVYGSLTVNSTISGVYPVRPEHLVTKEYVDSYVGTANVGQKGEYAIASGTSSFTVTFPTVLVSADSYVICGFQNTVDTNPAAYGLVITGLTTDNFTVELSGPTDSANYVLNWRAGTPNETESTGDGKSGVETIASGVNNKSVVFAARLGYAAYAPVCIVVNETDSNPARYFPTITTTSVEGFTATWEDTTDSANYKLHWRAGDPQGVFTEPNQYGKESISSGVDTFTVTYPTAYAVTDVDVVGTMVNTTDANPAKYGWSIIETTTSGFTVELSDITDSANYAFNWRAGRLS